MGVPSGNLTVWYGESLHHHKFHRWNTELNGPFSLDKLNYWRIHWVVSFLGGSEDPHGPAWCWLDADCSRHPCGVVSKMRTPNSHVLTLYFLIQINMLKYPQFYSIPLCPCDICMNGWVWHINSHRKKLTHFARDQLLWEFEAINHEATLEVHASQKVRAPSQLISVGSSEIG